MSQFNLKGKCALITGASSGLGADFARNMAQRGCNLILVARREGPMQQLAQELQNKHGVQITVLGLDLSSPEAPEQLYHITQSQQLQVDILINNAGFGLYGNFLDLGWEREQAMLQLDIMTLVALTKLYARDMVKQGWGRVLQVASIGAYQPCPTYASYGAAKSFVLNFSEAVNYELKGTGVSITTLSPGITETEFLKVSGQEKTFYQKIMMMQSDVVTRIGIHHMLRQTASVVPGLMNKLTIFSLRLISRHLATVISAMTMKSNSHSAP